MALTNETLDGRPECVAYIAGRVFYALDSIVYYTQLLEGQSLSQIDKCYQKNDPTAEQLSDILATDGGTIPINSANRIIQLFEYYEGVLVFADNGVWYISGPETGFDATNFSVKKISSEGCIGENTVVQTENSVLYWSLASISSIGRTQMGTVESTDISSNIIQTFYKNIPTASKQTANGFYNTSKQTVEWFYCDTETKDSKFITNSSLSLDLKVGGWFVNSYNTNLDYSTVGTYVSLIGAIAPREGALEQEDLYLFTQVAVGLSSSNLYYGFATKTNESFQDFGANFPTAYLDTGYETLEKPSNKKVAPYATLHFKQTEENWIDLGGGDLDLDKPSSCLVSSKWDWNDTDANGRFGPSQEAYKFRRIFVPDAAGPFNSGETVITTKIKMRGRGNAVSLRFEQTPGKNFELLGYTVQYNMKGKI